jgi:hypothetical protein
MRQPKQAREFGADLFCPVFARIRTRKFEEPRFASFLHPEPKLRFASQRFESLRTLREKLKNWIWEDGHHRQLGTKSFSSTISVPPRLVCERARAGETGSRRIPGEVFTPQVYPFFNPDVIAAELDASMAICH